MALASANLFGFAQELSELFGADGALVARITAQHDEHDRAGFELIGQRNGFAVEIVQLEIRRFVADGRRFGRIDVIGSVGHAGENWGDRRYECHPNQIWSGHFVVLHNCSQPPRQQNTTRVHSSRSLRLPRENASHLDRTWMPDGWLGYTKIRMHSAANRVAG